MLNILMLLIPILFIKYYIIFVYVKRFACTFYEFLIVSKY